MKRSILILFLALKLTCLYGTDYTTIDNSSKTVPKELKSVDQIANYLTNKLTTPADKTRAIYCWIAHNIKYDLAQLYANKTYVNTQEIIDDVLLKRKGICQNYAELFHALCRVSGVQSFVIKGYTKLYGQLNLIGHAWNIVKIDGVYYNIDVTWAAGYVNNGKYVHQFRDAYYFVPSDEFIKSHMPFDPIWQLSTNPLTHKEFEKSDFSKLKQPAQFNYSDSIEVLENKSELEKRIQENRRIIECGLTNKRIVEEVTVNKKYIDNENENSEKEKFNRAVGLYTQGVNVYNTIVNLLNKNNGNPESIKGSIKELVSAQAQIETAKLIFQTVHSTDSSVIKQLAEIKIAMNELLENIQKISILMNEKNN